MKPIITITVAIEKFLDNIRLSRSKNTYDTYSFALQAFKTVLESNNLDLDSPVSIIPEDGISWLAAYLNNFSRATEQLYLQSVKGFYKYISAERLADVNLSRVDLLKQQRSRRAGIRLPQFPVSDIEKVLSFINRNEFVLGENKIDRLRALRDKSFLLTLADTGLRVHEACKLKRGDIDWNEGHAVIIGKGDKQAVVRFSSRSMKALKDYLSVRTKQDGESGKPLGALPLFARHDKGAGKRAKGITTASGRNIVNLRVKQALGEKSLGTITPHSFRHYFVTTVLKASGNLKLAQELARHSNIQVTQRYAHLSNDELDKGYYDIFEKNK